jgi:tetratricopeptide (TPR) repeat protein
VLSGALYLAALLAFERARNVISLALFALALAARETAWTLPFALVLVTAARGEPLRSALRRAAPHFGVLVAAIVAMAALPAYRWLLQASLAHRAPGESLFAQVEGIAYLVTCPLLTLRVNFDPDVAVPPAPDLHWSIAAAGIGIALGVGIASLRRRPWLGFAILWFFLQLAPTNSGIARYDLVNDRELYLALAGPALIVGVALGSIRRRLAATIAALALVAALGVCTCLRNLDYVSEIALWEATVRASPGKARAWNNLGYAWQQAGDTDRARAAYARALLQDPGYARARINLDALPAR